MQELYERMIKDLLRKYVYARDFVDRADWQIEELETKKENRQVAKYGMSTPGGSSEGLDDKIININAKISMLKEKYNYSRSSLYEIANASLEHMARRIFGDA